MASKRVCSVSGCPNITDGGRCDDHKRAAEQRRGSAHSRGYDAKWRRTRRRYLASHPLCSEPDCKAPATDVDHDTPRSQGGTDDRANLVPLCHSCHSAKTQREDRQR